MGKRTVLLVLDGMIVATFASLLSWRLTGLSLHEAIGVALLVFVLVHAGVHWGWMESRASAVLRRTPRRLGELLINAGLFVAMAWRIPAVAVLFRRAFSFVLAIGVLGVALWGYERLSPAPGDERAGARGHRGSRAQTGRCASTRTAVS